MYRGRPWTMRQYAGFASAAESNRRYRYLLEQGVTGLSVVGNGYVYVRGLGDRYSLALLNGEWINQQASLIAKRLEHDAANDLSQQMQLAARWILGRSATPEELAEGKTLIEKLRNQAGQDVSVSLANYCLYLLNLNEFLYID